jgi:hypothetical protein
VAEREELEHTRPAVFEWEGEAVILFYTGGPFPESPFEIQKGSLESRSGLFGLDEVSELGVMVRKIRQGGELEEPVFIPWGSVHFVERLKYVEEAEVQNEGES